MFSYSILATRNPDPTWLDSDRRFTDRIEALDWAKMKVDDGYRYVSLTLHTEGEDDVVTVLHPEAPARVALDACREAWRRQNMQQSLDV